MIDLSHSALILVDIQNDFLPGGALAVPDGDRILEAVNALARRPFRAVIATQDWHPPHHCSFDAQGGPWPAHCVAGANGADFPKTLRSGPITHIIRKGVLQERDSYSGFLDNDRATSTGLDGLLKGLGIDHVVICGLALDYCVMATALDAVGCGYQTDVIPEACRGIAADPEATLETLEKQGVRLKSVNAF
ncbi:nicotinamidase [Gluconobacter albidus]|uniref:isochorismatase family protein n=1 Tax=Gluconobacter albidus TaxID=318683 RepID=UPI000989FB3A|nr:isochorismatase family protein [Gluconobacter albidus]AQS90901.1 nicotinamidase [Gluconobacter albidus]